MSYSGNTAYPVGRIRATRPTVREAAPSVTSASNTSVSFE